MELITVTGAAAASLSLVVLWWAVSGEAAGAAGGRNLLTGPQGIDLRQALLRRGASARAVGPLARRLANRARRLTPASRVAALERRILLAGAPPGWVLERVLAAKLLLGGGVAVYGTLRLVSSPSMGALVLTLVFAALGFFIPDVVLESRAQRRQRQIRVELPDTLDQITVAIEAGLGLEASMARAGRSGTGPTAEELLRTLQDVQAGMSRTEALRRLVERTDVPELRRFVMAVIQAEGYGLSIAEVLRVQAAELRVKRRQRAEERAMKLPVKLVFPVVLCIMPTIFIVVMGPGAMRIVRSFAGGGLGH